MKKTIQTTLLITLTSLALESAATKVVKHRDHWGIFGGYNLVRECSSETEEGKRIDLYCEGNGDMKCRADMEIFLHDNGYETTAPENALIESLHEFASEEAVDDPSGSKTEYITISYPDGVVITYQFDLTWYVNADNILVSTVEIN
jgi:hypothetical protein